MWQVRAAALVQQKGVDLGSPEDTEDAGRDQVLSGDPLGVSPPARKENGRESKKGAAGTAAPPYHQLRHLPKKHS